jgi:hypothetical protein
MCLNETYNTVQIGKNFDWHMSYEE